VSICLFVTIIFVSFDTAFSAAKVMQQCEGQHIYKIWAWKAVESSCFFFSRSYYTKIFYKGLGRNIININHCKNIVTKLQDKGKAICIQPGQTVRAVGG
jgi:anaerobic ribonucleoside-triphosphate reductase